MARPYTFDPDTALEAAMNVFWRDGYDLASLSELQDAMGIKRGSLYHEYGSKKRLFLKALNRYVVECVDPGVDLLLSANIPGRERINRFFEMVPASEPRGCLLCNTAAGAAGTDSDVRAAVSEQIMRLRRGFNAALSDEVPDKACREIEAAQLTQQYIGQRVEARASA